MKINNRQITEMINVKNELPKCNGVPYLVLLKHTNDSIRTFCSISTFYSGANPEWDFSWSFNESGQNFDKECKVTHWGYLPTHKNISL